MVSSEKRTRYLLIDVGAGTMDVLFYESPSDLHYKAVVQSPVLSISEEAARLSGNILMTGSEMGGGRLSEVLSERAKSSNILMTASAAMTLSHNPERVRSLGIRIVADDAAENLTSTGEYSSLSLTDLPMGRIEQIVTGFGVPFSFDVVGLCAQDHGMPPQGISHLDYRHKLFKERLDRHPHPDTLLFDAAEVPETFNRLKSMARFAKELPTEEIFIMDSGFAAILGASMDMNARVRENILVLDVATSHTVGAALIGGELAGFFEYHTRDIDLGRLEALLRDLADGKLDHAQILKEGGHGAYTRRGFGFKNVETIIATGPKRRLLELSKLPITFGAPLGDNMMTGNVGLLEAIRRRKQLPSMTYL